MKQSITQEFEYGCAIACLAFLLNKTYKEMSLLVGDEQAASERFYVRDMREFLNAQEMSYASKHIKADSNGTNYYTEGSIALVRRSRTYPTGHYLVRYGEFWMDPWINLTKDRNIEHTKSGFRKRLPVKPMYLIFPEPASNPVKQ